MNIGFELLTTFEQHIINQSTLNMLNCFKDYKRYIHVFNRILDLAWPSLVDEINSGTAIHVVCPTQPITCLMHWRHQEPVHQQAWHCPQSRNMMTSSNGNIFRVTGHLCVEFTGPGEFHAQRPVTRSFDVFFDLRLNKRLSKQSWGWWFGTLSRPLWRHRNEYSASSIRRVKLNVRLNALSMLLHINSLWPDGTKPLPEPMLTDHQWSPVAFI